MGKQVKGWVPPEEAFVEQEPAAKPATSWSPPEEAFQPVKKKDSADLSSENGTTPVGIKDSSEQSPRQSKPSKSPTAKEKYDQRIKTLQNTYQQQFESGVAPQLQQEQKSYQSQVDNKRNELQSQVDAGTITEEQANDQLSQYSTQKADESNQRFQSYQNQYANEFASKEGENLDKWAKIYQKDYEQDQFEENKIRNPAKSLAKSMWNTFRYQLPADILSGQLAMEKFPEDVTDKTFKSLPEPIQKFLTGPGFGPSDRPAGSDATLTGISWLDDALEKYASNRPKKEIEKPVNPTEERRKFMFRTAVGLKAQGDEENKYLVNSLNKAEDFVDYMNWAASALGQAGAQIPAAILSRGATAYGQEIGSIYMDGINRIAQERGISPQEVIDKKLDESLYPVVFGTAAGALETLGAKGVAKGLVDSFTKKEVMESLRNRGAALLKSGVTESSTEGGQSVLEQIGASKASGKTFEQALKEINPDDIIESFAQGGIGGTGLHAIGSSFSAIGKPIQRKNITDIITEAKQNIDVNNPESIKQAAEQIKQAASETTKEAETKVEQPVLEPTKPIEEPHPPITEQPAESNDVVNEKQENNPVDQPRLDQPIEGSNPETETIPVGRPAESEQQPSGIKKDFVPEEKVDQVDVDRRTDKQVFEQAKADVNSGKINPQAIVDHVVKEPRALQPHEVSGLVYYKAQLDNQIRDANERLVNGDESAKAELEALNQQVDKYHEMAVVTANQQSMAFRLRKQLLDSEYNLQSQINQYKAANNGEMSPEVLAKYQQLDQDLKAANQKIEQLQAQAEKTQQNSFLQQIAEQERTRRRKALTTERKQKITTFFDGLKADTSNKGMLSASVLPGVTLLPHVWNGSVEVVKQAVLTGVDVASAIQAGIDYIKSNHQGEFDEEKYRAGMTPLLKKAIGEQEPVKPTVEDGKISIPKSLIHDLVASGTTDINDLTNQVHAMIVDEHPDISKRQVRDAITQYGKTATLSKDQIDTKVRELKRTGRLISQLEDVQKGQRPKRSGLQRDKPTDQERRLQQQVNEAMKDLPSTKEEEEQVWKSAVERVKSRLRNQISDLENQIATGEKKPRPKGIEYDQEAKELAARRDELKEQLGQLEEGQSDEQRIRGAIKSTEKSLADLERRIKEKDFSKKEQRETPVTQELSDLRAKRDAARKEYDQLKQEEGIADQERLTIRKKAVQKAIDDYQRRIKEKDFEAKPKKEVVPDKELQQALRERERVKEEFDLEKERARLANRPMQEKIKDFAMDATNLPKSMLSSLDLSAVLRQGGVLLPTHPKAWAKSFVEMFRMAASEKYYNNWLRDLKSSDLWPLISNSKLFIADNNAKVTAHEEQFMSQLAKKIPIIGQSIRIGKNVKIPGLDLIGASSRAYSGFLNNLRAQVFASGVDHLNEAGYTPEKNPEIYKALADFINNATGRGKLAGKLENAAPILNTIFFSPRFMASRLNLINPAYYAKLPVPVRKEALKSTLSYIAFVSAIGAIGAAADWWDIELDPRSTDFGKFRIGKFRFDPWGGLQSYIRLIAQLATGEKKKISGEIEDLTSDKFNADTRLGVATRFLRGKLAPVPGAAVNLLEGKNVVGEPATLSSEALRLVAPLYLQDMQELYQQEGSASVAKTFLPAMFGIGVQYYQPQIKKSPTFQDRIMKRLENAMDIDKRLDRKQKEMEKFY